MIKLIQFDGANVTPQDDGAVFDQALGSGIFFGCVVSATGGNQLTVTAGRGIASGRSFSVEQETINATTSQSGSVPGRLLIEVDISNIDTPIKFVTQAQSPLPELIQQNLNNGGTVYQLPLSIYTVDAVQVSGLQNIDNSIVLPPEKGGTGKKSLDDLVVGTAKKANMLSKTLEVSDGGTGANDPQNAIYKLGASARDNLLFNAHFYKGALYNPGGKTELHVGDTKGPAGWNVEMPTGAEGIYMSDEGITMKPGEAASVGLVQPYTDFTKTLIGKMCTVTLIDGEGNLNKAKITIGNTGGGTQFGKFRVFSISSNFIYIRAYKDDTDEATIVVAKVETGDDQTLAKKNSNGVWEIIDVPFQALNQSGFPPYVCTRNEYNGITQKNPNVWYAIVG